MTMSWLCIKLVGGGRATKLRNLLNVDAVLYPMRQITILVSAADDECGLASNVWMLDGNARYSPPHEEGNASVKVAIRWRFIS
jgi:hypothetical protein